MRIRSIKPEFWTSAKIARVSRVARLVFIGLWNEADDEGRLLGSAKRLAGSLFAHDEDVDARIMSGWIDELEMAELVQRYSHRGIEYLFVVGFQEHQKIDKRRPSRLPSPPAVRTVAFNQPHLIGGPAVPKGLPAHVPEPRADSALFFGAEPAQRADAPAPQKSAESARRAFFPAQIDHEDISRPDAKHIVGVPKQTDGEFCAEKKALDLGSGIGDLGSGILDRGEGSEHQSTLAHEEDADRTRSPEAPSPAFTERLKRWGDGIEPPADANQEAPPEPERPVRRVDPQVIQKAMETGNVGMVLSAVTRAVSTARSKTVVGLAEAPRVPRSAGDLCKNTVPWFREQCARFPAYDGVNGRPSLPELITEMWPRFEEKLAVSSPEDALRSLTRWLSDDYPRHKNSKAFDDRPKPGEHQVPAPQAPPPKGRDLYDYVVTMCLQKYPHVIVPDFDEDKKGWITFCANNSMLVQETIARVRAGTLGKKAS